jgi:hypothetical protein
VTSLPSAPVAALSLVIGYAVAAGTGVRALGGVVLLLGLAWCVVLWRASSGTPVAVGLAAAYVVLFVGSHLLALAIGAWPSVVVVSVAMGALAWRLADSGRADRARRAPAGSGVG